MSARQFPVFPLFVLAAMIWAAYWAYTNLEIVEELTWVDASQESRDDPHLAANRLLTKNGFKTEIAKDRGLFSTLDDKSLGVLWIRNLSELADERETARVRQWVEAGGILLGSPAGDLHYNNPSASLWMLEALGIVPVPGTEPDTAILEHGDLQLHTEAIPGTETVIQLRSHYKQYFELDMTMGEGNMTNIIDWPYLIHQKVGDGYVAIYADEDLFINNYIHHYTTAYLLLWLTEPARVKTVAVVHTLDERPGLFTTLWRKFPVVIIVLGLVLAAFLRWAATRLGPIERETQPANNNLMAHLQARGEFWHRHKHTDKLISKVQEAAISKLGLNDSPLDTAEKSVVIKQATAQLQCSDDAALQALYGKPKNDRHILSTSRTLQKLSHRKTSEYKQS